MIELTKLELKNITEKLLGTFLNAGEVAKKISQKGVKITIKADKSPVTDGDLAVDALLRGKILNLTPGIPIISEETINIPKPMILIGNKPIIWHIMNYYSKFNFKNGYIALSRLFYLFTFSSKIIF